MTITIFGATGQVGKRAVRLALAQGYTIRAFSRDITHFVEEDLRNDNFQAIKGYVFEKNDVARALKGADAVISVLGGSIDGVDKTRSLGLKNIIGQMQVANVKRIITLGGYGVLSDEDGNYLVNDPEYLPQYKAVGLEHLQAYLSLKNSGLAYTFICSPNIRDVDSTEQYTTSAETPPMPNRFHIAAGDLAHFMLKELQENAYLQKRVGISEV